MSALLATVAAYCTFAQAVPGPLPGHAWVLCTRPDHSIVRYEALLNPNGTWAVGNPVMVGGSLPQGKLR